MNVSVGKSFVQQPDGGLFSNGVDQGPLASSRPLQKTH